MIPDFSGILTALKLGGLAVVVFIVGIFAISYYHKDAVIAEQKATIVSQASKIDVQAKNQKAADAVIKVLAEVNKEAPRDKAEMHKRAKEPTPDNFIIYTRRFRVCGHAPASPPKNGQATGHSP